MRSRFSAFAVGDARYLLASWDPLTRPPSLDLDPEQRWYRLDILRTEGGGETERTGIVEFRAFFRHPEGAGDQHESSRFRREGKSWLYVDGE